MKLFRKFAVQIISGAIVSVLALVFANKCTDDADSIETLTYRATEQLALLNELKSLQNDAGLEINNMRFENYSTLTFDLFNETKKNFNDLVVQIQLDTNNLVFDKGRYDFKGDFADDFSVKTARSNTIYSFNSGVMNRNSDGAVIRVVFYIGDDYIYPGYKMTIEHPGVILRNLADIEEEGKESSFRLAQTILSIISIVALAFTAYYFSRFIHAIVIAMRKPDKVFFDDFSSPNKYWGLNYWQGKSETVRFENGHLVLKASSNEEWPANGCDGAYIDLTYGILEGEVYQISCTARSLPNSTMGFQLWIHDTTGNEPNAFDPPDFETPPVENKVYKVTLRGTSKRSIRVHLHARIGVGAIMISNVTVIKL